ncbi:MAG: hypothetical protein AAB845_02595 [Patescibacteria group bacterium]
MKKYIAVTFFALLIAYALFQGRYLILGPKVVIDSPVQDSLVDEGVLMVIGEAKNVAYLSLDDRQIYTDTNGRFEEKLIAHKGINIIKLEARDRFGRKEEFLTRVYVK